MYAEFVQHEGLCPVCDNYHALNQDQTVIWIHSRRVNGKLVKCEGSGRAPEKKREHTLKIVKPTRNSSE